MTISVNTHCQL